jgi:hypothetical protein
MNNMKHKKMIYCLMMTFSMLLMINNVDSGEAEQKQSKAKNENKSISVKDWTISFNPKLCRGDTQLLVFGMGFLKLSVLDHNESKCIIEYSLNIEQGFKGYRCTVPEIEKDETIELIFNKGNVIPEIKTTFDSSKCELIKRDTPYYRQKVIKEGKGKVAQDGNKIFIKYNIFTNDKYELYDNNITKDQIQEFKYTSDIDSGMLHKCIQEMCVGEVKNVVIPTSQCKELNKIEKAKLSHPVLYLQIELIKIE